MPTRYYTYTADLGELGERSIIFTGDYQPYEEATHWNPSTPESFRIEGAHLAPPDKLHSMPEHIRRHWQELLRCDLILLFSEATLTAIEEKALSEEAFTERLS